MNGRHLRPIYSCWDAFSHSPHIKVFQRNTLLIKSFSLQLSFSILHEHSLSDCCKYRAQSTKSLSLNIGDAWLNNVQWKTLWTIPFLWISTNWVEHGDWVHYTISSYMVRTKPHVQCTKCSMHMHIFRLLPIYLNFYFLVDSFGLFTNGLYSLRRRRHTGIGIPIINLRRSADRLRFIIGIPIPMS